MAEGFPSLPIELCMYHYPKIRHLAVHYLPLTHFGNYSKLYPPPLNYYAFVGVDMEIMSFRDKIDSLNEEIITNGQNISKMILLSY